VRLSDLIQKAVALGANALEIDDHKDGQEWICAIRGLRS
jgi:hypothetical protein